MGVTIPFKTQSIFSTVVEIGAGLLSTEEASDEELELESGGVESEAELSGAGSGFTGSEGVGSG